MTVAMAIPPAATSWSAPVLWRFGLPSQYFQSGTGVHALHDAAALFAGARQKGSHQNRNRKRRGEITKA
jgi:hypothetical protein